MSNPTAPAAAPATTTTTTAPAPTSTPAAAPSNSTSTSTSSSGGSKFDKTLANIGKGINLASQGLSLVRGAQSSFGSNNGNSTGGNVNPAGANPALANTAREQSGNITQATGDAQRQSLQVQQELIRMNMEFQTAVEILRTISTAFQTILRTAEQERINIRSARA